MKQQSTNANHKINWRMVALAVFFLGAALAAGWYVFARKTASKRTFKEVKVEQGDLEVFVQATGQVQPENRLVVKPSIAGRIETVLTDEGKAVRAGQILAWMSSNDRAALLDLARAKGDEEVKHWEDIYKPSTIIAPLSGFVIAKGVEPGQVVSTGDTAFVISDRLVVNAQVDETDLGRVKLNQIASIQLDAYSDQTILGKVSRIAYEARTANNVTIYDIRILPATVPDFMRSGMTASVRFIETTQKDVLKVPTSLFRKTKNVKELRRPGSELKVLLKTGDEGATPVFIEKTVKLGASDGKMVEITEGIAVNDVLLDETTADISEKPSNPFSPFGNKKSGGPKGTR